MKTILLPVSLVVMASSTLGNALGQHGKSLPAYQPSSTTARMDNGISWTVTMPSECTTHDSVRFRSYMRNNTSSLLDFRLQESSGPQIVLRDGQGKLVRRSLSQLSIRTLAYRRWTRRSETLHDFETDLRADFGQLAPGTYEFYVVWPADAYHLGRLTSGNGPADRLNGDRSMELTSPKRRLVVKPTDLSKALAAIRSISGPFYMMMVLAKDRIQRMDEAFPQVTLENNLKHPVEFGFLPNGDGDREPPLRVPRDSLTVYRWSASQWCVPIEGRQDLARVATDKEKEGLGDRLERYRLMPGKTVQLVHANDGVCLGDGIYSYRMWVDMIVVGHPTGVRTQVYSQPFLVSRVAR